jgi:flagellar biosynthesis protein FlhG
MMHVALDQARGLRQLLRPAGVRVLPVFGTLERLPAMVNLATALARAGQRTLVLDATRGEIAPAFGLAARYELKHVLEGDIAFAHAVLTTRDGVRVLPAARGVRMLTEARVGALDFFESLAQKAGAVDLIMVNCDAGDRAVRLIPAHGEALLIASREPHALAEGAACLKRLALKQSMARFRVMMMRTAFEEARQAVATLARLTGDTVNVELAFGGNAPPDRRLWEASRIRRSIFDIDPAGVVARSFQNAAAGVIDWDLARVAATAAPPELGARQAVPAATHLH